MTVKMAASADNKTMLILEEFLGEKLAVHLEPGLLLLELARDKVNGACSVLDPTLIIIYTTVTILSLVWLYNFVFQEESLLARAKKSFFYWLKRMPYIGAMIQKELDKTLDGVRRDLMKPMQNKTFIQALPESGKSAAAIMSMADSYKSLVTINPQEGRVSGAVYAVEEPELIKLISQFYGRFSYSNPLHMDIFVDVRKMEAEVVRMCLSMFNGGPETCGTLSSGGTESILLACKAYRNRAYERGIKYPEMIVASSGHAAFDKAAACFKIKLVRIPVDSNTWALRPSDVKSAITSNTCMLVVSAPSFPHGIVEPVEEVAKLGLKYDIPVHVDCCLGGFLLPFMEKAGFFDIPPFDFRVPGVTSISCDTHKYGCAPKGSSVIMYSRSEYRNHQFDVLPDWTGGIYATPTFAGSRCGANATCCWATMMYVGERGYVENTKRIIDTTRYIRRKLEGLEHIYMLGDPKVSVIAFGSLDFNIYRLYDYLSKKGWHLNALQFPAAFHICVTLPITREGNPDQFIRDVQDGVDDVMQEPNAKCAGMGALYGMAQSIPDRRIVNEICTTFLSTCYNTENPTANGTHS